MLVASFAGRPPGTPVRALGILYEESQSFAQRSFDSLRACRSTASHTKMRVLTLRLGYEVISLVVSKLEERNGHLAESRVFTFKGWVESDNKTIHHVLGLYQCRNNVEYCIAIRNISTGIVLPHHLSFVVFSRQNCSRVLSVCMFRKPEVFILFEMISTKSYLLLSSFELIPKISLDIIGLEGGKPEESSL